MRDENKTGGKVRAQGKRESVEKGTKVTGGKKSVTL